MWSFVIFTAGLTAYSRVQNGEAFYSGTAALIDNEKIDPPFLIFKMQDYSGVN